MNEKKQQHDINTLNTFNKVLNRIHNKIKITSRQNLDGQFCWFLVPETIIGVPKYDHNNCIVYIINKKGIEILIIAVGMRREEEVYRVAKKRV